MEPVKQITKNIIRIMGQNPSPMSLQGTNTYLIGNQKERTLIDSGQNIPEYKDLLLNVLKETGSKINQVILTHCHHDHSHGVKQILEIYENNVKIKKFKRMEQDEILENKYGFKYEYLQRDDIIKGDNFKLQTLPMTGHLPDHCCYYLFEDQALFTGDFILSGSSSVVRDLKEQFRNYDQSLELKPKLLLSGHGPEIVGQENVKNIIMENYNHRLKREKQILSVLIDNNNKQVDVSQILKQVYPDLKSEKLIQGALNNIRVHLNKLIYEKKVKENQQDNVYQYIENIK